MLSKFSLLKPVKSGNELFERRTTDDAFVVCFMDYSINFPFKYGSDNKELR